MKINTQYRVGENSPRKSSMDRYSFDYILAVMATGIQARLNDARGNVVSFTTSHLLKQAPTYPLQLVHHRTVATYVLRILEARGWVNSVKKRGRTIIWMISRDSPLWEFKGERDPAPLARFMRDTVENEEVRC